MLPAQMARDEWACTAVGGRVGIEPVSPYVSGLGLALRLPLQEMWIFESEVQHAKAFMAGEASPRLFMRGLVCQRRADAKLFRGHSQRARILERCFAGSGRARVPQCLGRPNPGAD